MGATDNDNKELDVAWEGGVVPPSSEDGSQESEWLSMRATNPSRYREGTPQHADSGALGIP